MITLLRNFWNDESGPTAIEYALIAALIAVAIIAALQALQGSISGIFEGIGQQLDTAAGNLST